MGARGCGFFVVSAGSLAAFGSGACGVSARRRRRSGNVDEPPTAAGWCDGTSGELIFPDAPAPRNPYALDCAND
jgi:hypothetical protein